MSIMKVYQFVCARASFPVGFECGMWDFIILVPDHCLSFYLLNLDVSVILSS